MCSMREEINLEPLHLAIPLELIDYYYECCVFLDLTPEEREIFGLPPE